MLYHMKLVFSLDISEPTLNEMTERIDGSHVVLKDAMECTLEQTIPFIPNAHILDEYKKAISKGYESPTRHVENIRFVRYDFVEPIDKDTPQNGMSAERAKQLLFEVLQLFRRKAEADGNDPNDFDDWMFSCLDMEIQELEEIYRPYPNITVYGSACYEQEQSPKDFDKKYFAQ